MKKDKLYREKSLRMIDCSLIQIYFTTYHKGNEIIMRRFM